ncbi:L-type lectin-domain containing receptor kinase IV.1 [Acorus gramineus]|uniref:non-specific serine/threonine protein kinase n=1 Tax=Acorus gramineus TaxID=55184 RepID=A0AAV9BJK8_ACOGR|nr:L-type lectin-domain containing receptor kinase IV.1 [Acorus gramineus]
MSLNGLAEITSNGLLRLTNTTQQQQGHAFYPTPLHFNKSFSFSTTFVFAIFSEDPELSGHGIAFVLSPNTDLPGSFPSQYLGLFSESNNGKSSNHVIAVELDTIFNYEFGDIDNNHVGIDVNSLRSVEAQPAGYFSDGSNRGFRWSFNMTGRAQDLDLSKLPSLPRIGPKEKPKVLTVGLPVILSVVVLMAVSIGVMLRRRRKFVELMEDWEHEYGPHRFSYKELYTATRGFRERELLGTGGFGKVYKGMLPKNKCEVAIKRVSLESRQGMREFVAEIVSIGRLRHHNIVQLLGYCRRKGELLLVYDYMSNGSLDKLLFDRTKKHALSWSQRFHIVRGVASGLLYLHEGWEQLVIHRDIKSSNVLLDGDMNARLGDFGLARLYDHGTDPQTTLVAGTLGYLAPELSKTGKGTTATDVFSFGAFLLEVVCGRRPIDIQVEETMNTMDWVLDHWLKGTVMETVDERPSMRQVMQFLDHDVELPDLSADYMNVGKPYMEGYQGFDDFFMSYATSSN